MSLDECFIKFSNNVLNHSTGIIKSVASVLLHNHWSTFNRKLQLCVPHVQVLYDSISDVERTVVSVLDDVISLLDGYKQCHQSHDEILLTIEIICTN